MITGIKEKIAKEGFCKIGPEKFVYLENKGILFIVLEDGTKYRNINSCDWFVDYEVEE